MAKKIPGKEEFYETIRYFGKQIELTGVNLYLSTKVSLEMLNKQDYDEIVIATGVEARLPEISGIEHQKVLSYIDVLYHGAEVGNKVAIIGAGGIGFDIAEYLSTDLDHSPSLEVAHFMKEWGVDMEHKTGGSLAVPEPEPSLREIYLLKRSAGKHGKGLGKTTGWIHRSSLKMKKINMIAQVEYNKIDDSGLHITVGGERTVLDVDHIIICAGQNPLRDLYEPLVSAGKNVHLVGGADEAKELDAKRAIDQAARLVATM